MFKIKISKNITNIRVWQVETSTFEYGSGVAMGLCLDGVGQVRFLQNCSGSGFGSYKTQPKPNPNPNPNPLPYLCVCC